MSSARDIAQQFIDGGVIPADLAGQDAATKTYVDEQLAQRDQSIAANASAASGINTKVDSHIADPTVHVTPSEKAVYNGHVANTDIHVTTSDKASWNSKAPGSTQTDLAAHVGNADIHTTAGEKAKLAGIQTGAEVNQSAFSKVNDVNATTKTDVLTITGGTGITVTTNPAGKTMTITATGQATPGPHASTHITGGADVIPDAVIGGNSGLMSGTDAQFVRVDGETKTGSQAKADAVQAAAASDATSKANAVQSNLTAHLADNTAHNLGSESLLTTTKTIKGAINEVVTNYVRQPAYAQTAGTATAYTATLIPAPGSIADGFGITIVPHVDSGASPTLSINGLTAVPLKNIDGTVIQMKAGKPYAFRKVGTDFLASSSGGGVTIKTLQRGTTVIGVNQDIVNVTITSVDATKAIIRFGFYTNTNVASKAFVTGVFSNNTTLLFARNVSDASATVTIYWEVIEFGNVKSVQKGSTSSAVSSSGTNVTISEVNTSNSLIFYSFTAASNDTSGKTVEAARFVNSTTISLLGQPSGSGTNYFNYQVIEFND